MKPIRTREERIKAGTRMHGVETLRDVRLMLSTFEDGGVLEYVAEIVEPPEVAGLFTGFSRRGEREAVDELFTDIARVIYGFDGIGLEGVDELGAVFSPV